MACFDIEKPDLIQTVADQKFTEEEIYASRPVIDFSKCRFCGVCSGYCPQKAIQFNRFIPSVTLIVSRCFACGNCLKGCDHNGIQLQVKLSGKIIQTQREDNHFIGGKLDGSSEFKIPLIKALLERLKPETTVICDFEPGNSAAVDVGLSKMDVAVIVLCPDSGWEKHLSLMLDTVEKSQAAFGVLLNKVTPGMPFVNDIRRYCTNQAVPVFGLIPIDKSIETNIDFTEHNKSELPAEGFYEIWEEMCKVFPTPLPNLKIA